MASLATIPVFVDAPNWHERVTLDNQPYTMAFRWNQRDGFWRASLWDEAGPPNGTAIRLGQKIVPFLTDATTDALLRSLAADDVSRAKPPGTSARRLSLFPGALPGLMWAQSGAPLLRQMTDLAAIQIYYLDAEAVAAIHATVRAAA